MTEGPAGADSIAREIRIAAEADAIWRAWTEPHGLASWFVDRAAGAAEPGGTMRWYWDAFGVAAEVRVEAAEAPHHLVLRHTPARMLEIRIQPLSGGETLLRVVESGFSGAPSEREEREDVASGWALALAVLRVALERHAGHRRAEVLVMRPALFNESVLPGLQRSREGLGRWLLPALADVPFDGEALEVTAREAVWSWPSVNGVLEVKAFSGGAGRTLALRASAWGAGHGALEALRPRLEHALERLAALVTRS